MKIAVIGYPRTGSTKLCFVLEQLYNPTRYIGELLTHSTNMSKTIELINRKQPCIIKLFSYQFNDTPINLVDWKQFDLVCFTSRASIVDSFISMMIANKRKQWIPGINKFVVDDPFILDSTLFAGYYASHIEPLRNIIAVVEKVVIKTSHLTYAEIADTPTLLMRLGHNDRQICIPVTPTGINYREKCLNYDEIECAANDFNLV